MNSSPENPGDGADRAAEGVHSPMETFSPYRGRGWSPERLAFHQNLEQFADRVGLIVGLQGNGKMSQEDAYRQIKDLLAELKSSRKQLLK